MPGPRLGAILGSQIAGSHPGPMVHPEWFCVVRAEWEEDAADTMGNLDHHGWPQGSWLQEHGGDHVAGPVAPVEREEADDGSQAT